MTLHAVLRNAKGVQVAAVHEAQADRPAVLEKKFPLGKKIACDSGTTPSPGRSPGPGRTRRRSAGRCGGTPPARSSGTRSATELSVTGDR
ncbi:hypothetical protein ACM614_00875 [Streptomyces sp. 12297]